MEPSRGPAPCRFALAEKADLIDKTRGARRDAKAEAQRLRFFYVVRCISNPFLPRTP